MILGLFAFWLAGQTPAASEPKPAEVEGAVVHAATKQAIRKAKVTLTPVTSTEAAYSAETDDNGKYVIKEVKTGRYRLTAEKTGYQKTAYGARGRDTESGQQVRVDAGAELRGLTIGMPKQAVIAGKILDTDGEPVVRALVFALTTVYQNGKKYQVPAGSVPTLSNDLGEYRVSQLPPGQYVLCALPMTTLSPAPTPGETKPVTEEAQVYTCYPNTGRAADAAALEVKDGGEIPGIDIRLMKVKTVNVRGRITGMPASAGTMSIFSLSPKGAGALAVLSSPRSILQGTDGKFEFKGVTPGSYVMHSIPVGGTQSFVVKHAIEVGEQPVSDLVVSVITPFELKGQCMIEGGGEAKLGAMKVILSPDDEVVSSVSISTVGDKGEFTAGNLIPGRHRLQVTGLATGYYLKSVRLGEQAVEGSVIEVLTSAAGPLTLTLEEGKTAVTGLVRDEKGDPAPGVWVVFAPTPKNSFRQRLTKTDQNGIYRLPNLPPGEFQALAFESLEPGRLEDEEFLKPFLSKAKKVEARGTGQQSLDLLLLQ